MKSAFRGKAIALVGVIAALLIGLSSIDGLVNERRARQKEAQASVADALAGAQTLQGPMLRRQCSETWEVEELVDKTRKLVAQRRDFTLTAWPASVDVRATVGIEARYRGLFKINSYLSNMQMQATWPELLALQGAAKHKGGRVQCEAVQVALTLSDACGIRSASVQQAEVSAQGFHALWQVNALASGCEPAKAETAGCAEQFGVSFIDPVNAYSLSDRALKYGVLFIALSFIAVGLVEVLNGEPSRYALRNSPFGRPGRLKRLRVHPMQVPACRLRAGGVFHALAQPV